ncbi:MAG TPA: hypothetical protein VHF06_31510 [Pseudonocardiaceae bacterium]|nr:hypothetical protein [Pseudonocardiaceae bacterium]
MTMTTDIHTASDLAGDNPNRTMLLRRLAAARSRYEEELGWPVTIDVRPGRLLMLTGPVADVVTMPTALGRLVLSDLRIAMLAGPVVADPTGQWWMFFTEPARGSHIDEELTNELSSLDVTHIPTGTYVVVPTNLDGANTWPWVERPRRNQMLPPWPAVVATTRRNGTKIS